MKGRLVVKNGKYYVVISYQDESSKSKQKWVATGLDEKNNKRAALDMLRTIEAKFANGTLGANSQQSQKSSALSAEQQEDVSSNDSPLFSDYLYEWLQIAKTNIQVTTYSVYKHRVEYIAAYFAEKRTRLKDLKPKDIQEFYTYMQQNGKSVQEAHHCHTVLHRALEVAYRSDYILTNPADKVERPKSPKFKAKFYTAEQMLTLFQKLQGDPYEYIYKLTAIYGLRRSEVCGLRWSAINFENDTITLDHAVVQCEVDGKRVLVTKDKMKNQSSMRTLPLLPAVKDILLNLKREQQERAEKYGQYYNRQYRDYVCVDEVGKLIRPDTLTTHFKSFLVRNNLPVIRFHELRHSCASILIASGVSMKAVQEWLGHSTFSTTADIYSHLNFSSKLGIADTLSDILAGNTMLKRQTAPDTIETMRKIFSTAEIEKPANENHLQTFEVLDEYGEPVEENAAAEVSQDTAPDDADDLSVFKKAKEEMSRLGLETLDEYFEYLDFQERLQKRRDKSKDLEM